MADEEQRQGEQAVAEQFRQIIDQHMAGEAIAGPGGQSHPTANLAIAQQDDQSGERGRDSKKARLIAEAEQDWRHGQAGHDAAGEVEHDVAPNDMNGSISRVI